MRMLEVKSRKGLLTIRMRFISSRWSNSTHRCTSYYSKPHDFALPHSPPQESRFKVRALVQYLQRL